MTTEIYLNLETAYGRFRGWMDVTTGRNGAVIEIDFDIECFEPSDEMRHKIVQQYRQVQRKPRRMTNTEGIDNV